MKDQIVHMPVTECMSPDLITVGPYQSLAEAYELMRENQIRRLPVLSNDKLKGIITLKDILEAKPPDVAHRLSLDQVIANLSNIVVELAMTREPVCVYRTDTLGHAAELMLERKIGGLPVIDANGLLVGLITESDIFRRLAHAWRSDNVREIGAV
jgi:acetoin utilization protein AcuB